MQIRSNRKTPQTSFLPTSKSCRGGFETRPYRGMPKKSATLLVATLILGLGSGFARAEKIRTAIPQANLNYLSIFVADARGFFRDEGLDNETVVISGPLSIAALLSGDVDF